MFKFIFWQMFLLFPLPYLIWRFIPAARYANTDALSVPNLNWFKLNLAQANLQSSTKQFSKIRWLIMLFIWISLLCAAARPQWVSEPIDLPISGRDLMLAVDLSGSMQQEDMQINGNWQNRLIAVKHVVSGFIEQRQGDRLGLILFADHAYLQTPLSYDLATIGKMLQEAEIGLVGKQTAIGEAIGLAIKRMKDLNLQQSQSRILILLTDGANTAGIQPIEMAKLAKEIGLKIYTIGIGADMMEIRTIFGRQQFNPSKDLDEKTLKSIAQITAGQYYRAKDTENLKKIYSEINNIEPIVNEKKSYRLSTELFYWPLSVALLTAIFAFLFFYLRNRRTQ